MQFRPPQRRSNELETGVRTHETGVRFPGSGVGIVDTRLALVGSRLAAASSGLALASSTRKRRRDLRTRGPVRRTRARETESISAASQARTSDCVTRTRAGCLSNRTVTPPGP